MGFYHQIDRAFRLKFSHHPILWLIPIQSKSSKSSINGGKFTGNPWVFPIIQFYDLCDWKLPRFLVTRADARFASAAASRSFGPKPSNAFAPLRQTHLPCRNITGIVRTHVVTIHPHTKNLWCWSRWNTEYSEYKIWKCQETSIEMPICSEIPYSIYFRMNIYIYILYIYIYKCKQIQLYT